MSTLLSEQQVLRKLGIKDFRNLTKTKVIHLASMLDKMDPEVAKKALEQFPEFAKTTSEMLHEYKDTLDKSFSSNDESIRTVYDAYNSIIASLQKELDKENIPFEERKYIIEQMKEIADKISDKDTENKRWLATMCAIAGIAITGLAAGLAAALGANTQAESTDSDDDIIDV